MSRIFIHRDDVVSAFMDIQPVKPGHVLVVPLSHVHRLADQSQEAATHMMGVAYHVAPAQRKAELRCEGVDIILADG